MHIFMGKNKSELIEKRIYEKFIIPLENSEKIIEVRYERYIIKDVIKDKSNMHDGKNSLEYEQKFTEEHKMKPVSNPFDFEEENLIVIFEGEAYQKRICKGGLPSDGSGVSLHLAPEKVRKALLDKAPDYIARILKATGHFDVEEFYTDG